MARPPILRGTLREGGAIELLRELETKRITGELRFESDDEAGLIVFYGGEIALEQELRGDGRDPVDVFLELKEGTYEIRPRLPALPVSKGDDYVKTGSLAVHVPADLMSYCERGGLTGRLELSHEGRRAEAIYDAGELLAIELDGRGDVELSEVFAWEQGRFRIELDPSAPARFREAEAEEAETTEYVAVPKRREDTSQFLRVVEMALVDVLERSEKARSPTRTSPPMPPPPKARPRPPAVPPPPRRKDEHTVRLIYLTGDPPSLDQDTTTRHVARGSALEIALTDARPERRAATTDALEPEPMPEERETNETQEEAEQPRASEPSAEGIGGGKEAHEADVAAPEAKVDTAASESRADSAENDLSEKDRERVLEELNAQPPLELPAVQKSGGIPLAGVGWALVVLLLGFAILALLAQLPPLS